jgi:hypothetical protein
MPDLTDEEYDALDEYWTTHTPKLSGNGESGFFAKRKAQGDISPGDMLIFLDDVSAAYLRVKSADTHTTPGELIAEMLREKMGRKPRLRRFAWFPCVTRLVIMATAR